MNKILSVLVLALVPIFVSAQSVLITPGAQSVNGESTSQDQLNVFGNGLLVAPKTKFTEDDPAGSVYTMNCASATLSNSLAGTIKDPSGDADYTGGLSYDCSFFFSTYNPLFQAYQIDFESLDTEVDGDTVYVLDAFSNEVLRAYSGNALPTSLIVSNNGIRIKFKTDNDANVGSGFVLEWKAIIKTGGSTAIQNYTGKGLVYDMESHALWTGEHSLMDFENRGDYSTSLGYSTVASDDYSTALGYSTVASGYSSTALGNGAAASGYSSTALGRSTISAGNSTTAMGFETESFGDYSTAMGNNTESIGEYSTAMGRNSKAAGRNSIAIGRSTEALGENSTAMGNFTVAGGENSTAMGSFTEAASLNSTAMGYLTDAYGDYSTAMGYSTEASGDYSTAIGFNTTASGNYSASIGIRNITSGDYSYALGTRASTNGHSGAMVLADYVTSGSADTLFADASNRLLARFENGYTFYTDNNLSSATKYGIMAHNKANSWSSVSDSTKKENFIASNGEKVLKSVSKMRIGTWNYKGDDTFKNRHWGVMAQDFHHHFGKDAYGTIGNDTTIATADFDGVSFAAIKALEARTRELQEELASEKRFSASLELTTENLTKTTEQNEETIGKLKMATEEQKQTIKELQEQLLSMRSESMSVQAESRTVQAESKALKEDFKELKEMLLKSVAVKP